MSVTVNEQKLSAEITEWPSLIMKLDSSFLNSFVLFATAFQDTFVT